MDRIKKTFILVLKSVQYCTGIRLYTFCNFVFFWKPNIGWSWIYIFILNEPIPVSRNNFLSNLCTHALSVLHFTCSFRKTYIELSSALFQFPMFASITEIVLVNNATFAEFNREKMINAIIFFEYSLNLL